MQICPELPFPLRLSHCMSVFVSVTFIISLLSLFFPLSLSACHYPVFIFVMFLYAWNSPCVRVLVADISVLHSSLWVSGAGIQRHHPPLLTSLTEGYQSKAWCVSHRAGGTDFPSTGFYLCLNVTALKAQNSLLAEVSFTFYPHFSYLRPLTTTLNHACVLSGTFDAPSVAREHRRAAKTFLC